MNQALRILLGLGFILNLQGCVSVQIGPKGPDTAKNVKFEPPPDPYEKFEIPDVDKAWKNKKNGNSISFRTACNDPVESEIDSIQHVIQDGLDSATVESSVKTMYNGREALQSVIQGKLDGVSTKLEVMIFKKNRCTYTLTYVALPQNFKKDQSVFEIFLKKFEAP
jgi:hypothetical protein